MAALLKFALPYIADRDLKQLKLYDLSAFEDQIEYPFHSSIMMTPAKYKHTDLHGIADSYSKI